MLQFLDSGTLEFLPCTFVIILNNKINFLVLQHLSLNIFRVLFTQSHRKGTKDNTPVIWHSDENRNKNNGNGYDAMLYRKHYSNASGGSGTGASSLGNKRRKKAHRWCLFVVLLLFALIIAALLGWLMYYLLTRGRPAMH